MIFHVTDLDSIIWYKKIETMTAEDLRKRLLRLEPPNEKMMAGTAWHKIMEDADDGMELSQAVCDGFQFDIKLDRDIEISMSDICEVRAKKDYRIDGYTITLTGKCDGITGNEITDHKLTFRPNPESYLESYQWRAYLDIFEADIFKYRIYSAREKDKHITIYNISTMDLYRYPGMEDDIKSGIRDLLEFVKEFVPEKLQ